MLFPIALTEVGIHSRRFCGQESSAMPAVFQASSPTPANFLNI